MVASARSISAGTSSRAWELHPTAKITFMSTIVPPNPTTRAGRGQLAMIAIGWVPEEAGQKGYGEKSHETAGKEGQGKERRIPVFGIGEDETERTSDHQRRDAGAQSKLSDARRPHLIARNGITCRYLPSTDFALGPLESIRRVERLGGVLNERQPPSRSSSNASIIPDEERRFEKGLFRLVTIGGMELGRAEYQPGWHWAKHVGPIAGTKSCAVEHIGLVLSGGPRSRWTTARRWSSARGRVLRPAGHDSWVVGNEPYVSLHLHGASGYAAKHAPKRRRRRID
jgi:hypothetical protein